MKENTKNIFKIGLLILIIVFFIVGSTLAYYSWKTTNAQKTSVTFTTEKGFSCSADVDISIGTNVTSSIPISPPPSALHEKPFSVVKVTLVF